MGTVKKDKKVMSFKTKSLILTFLFALFLFIGGLLINNAIKVFEDERIFYEEKSLVDYNVELKENNYYEKNILDKNMSYVANLIDKINVNFKYNFYSNVELYGSYSYDVIGTLKITNPDTGDEFLSKEYVILDAETFKLNSNNLFNINESVKIDYDHYNELANRFQEENGVTADCKLIVTLRVTRDIDKTVVSNKKLDDTGSMSAIIPLSKKAVSIDINYNEVNKSDRIVSDKSVSIGNITTFGLGISSLLISMAIFDILAGVLGRKNIELKKND